MRCPGCGTNNDKVIDTRHNKKLNSIRRRRVCQTCSNRFTTYESIMTTEAQKHLDAFRKAIRKERV